MKFFGYFCAWGLLTFLFASGYASGGPVSTACFELAGIVAFFVCGLVVSINHHLKGYKD